MMVTIPDGLTEGASFVVNVPTMPIGPVVAAVPVPDIVDTMPIAPVVPPVPDVVDIVRKKGPLGIEAAKQYAYSIPVESRKIERCRTIYCGNNACFPGCWIGCGKAVKCSESCVWLPICVLFNPFLYVNLCICFCSDGAGGWADNNNDSRMYEVSEDHTLACYYTCGSCVEPSPTQPECCYCVPNKYIV